MAHLGDPGPLAGRYHYSAENLVTAVESSGISEGEVVFLTAGLGNLGIPSRSESFEELSRLAVEVIIDVVGSRGGVLVPTYSYSFGGAVGRPEGIPVFDVQHTPSTLGVFSEWFRSTMAEGRSRDPMVSVAALGAGAVDVIQDVPPTSYGHGSIFERLLTTKSGVLNLGMGPRWTPFIHYVDFLCQVPHRYEKTFSGIIRSAGKDSTVAWTYHVPVRIPNARGLGEGNGQAALSKGLWDETRIGRSRILHADYNRYFDFTMKRTQADPWNLAVGPPIDLEGIPRD